MAEFTGETPGFYERGEEGWAGFSAFSSLPRIDWDSGVRFTDLTGNGLSDMLMAEDATLVWHRSLGEAGFAPGERRSLERGEERGPGPVLTDGSQSVYLADLSGGTELPLHQRRFQLIDRDNFAEVQARIQPRGQSKGHLEAPWRGLHYLVQQSETGDP